MDLFPRCFLLVFGQLAVGGFLALSVPPFHQIERGFYKSSAGIYLFMGSLAAIGTTALRVRNPAGGGAWLEVALWWVFMGSGTAYLSSLWGENERLRARTFIATWASGVLTLIVSAQLFHTAGAFSIESVIYPLSFLVSALLLGSVMTGLLLGHWYLIDRDLPLAPFHQILAFYIALVVAQAVMMVLSAGLLALLGEAATSTQVATLFTDHLALLGGRVLVGPITCAVLAWMIWQTLKIPQTMAATGLFYIAILAALVGEFLGRFILFRTSLPL